MPRVHDDSNFSKVTSCIIRPEVVNNDLSTRQPKCSLSTLVLYLSNPQSCALFPSTNQNQVQSCLQNLNRGNEETCSITSLSNCNVLNLFSLPSQTIDLRQSDDFFIVEMEDLVGFTKYSMLDANTDPHGNIQ